MRSCCTVARSHRPGRVVVRVSCVSECEWSVSPPPVQVSWFYRSLLVWPLQQLYSFFSLQLPRNDDGEEINGHSLTSGSQLSARFSNCLFFSPPFSTIVQKHPTDFLVPPLYPPSVRSLPFLHATHTHTHTHTHSQVKCLCGCLCASVRVGTVVWHCLFSTQPSQPVRLFSPARHISIGKEKQNEFSSISLTTRTLEGLMIGLLHKVEANQAYTDRNPLAGVLLVRVCLLCVSVSIVWAAGIFGLVPLRLLTPS